MVIKDYCEYCGKNITKAEAVLYKNLCEEHYNKFKNKKKIKSKGNKGWHGEKLRHKLAAKLSWIDRKRRWGLS